MLLPISRIALATLALALVAAPAHAAGKPDLVIADVSSPRAVAAGATLTASFRARNTGGAAARASVTRFSLTADVRASAKARNASRTDPRTSALDALLEGERAVTKLRACATSPAARVSVTVPATLAPGVYTLLVCADELPPLDDGALAQRMQLAQQLSCTPAIEHRRVASPKAALKSIRSALHTQVGAPALAAFNASPEASSASASAAAATALLAEGNLGAALTAQLRAAELAPRDGAQLANAAALAVAAGHPNEALALLDGATAAGGGPGLAYGVDRRAAAQQIRGMALLQLGQAAPAQQALAAAAKADPSLDAEAASGQAARALCAGQTAAAAPLFKRAARRTPGNTPVALDEAHGRASQLRALALPGTPGEAVKPHPRFDDLVERGLAGESSALHDAEGANRQALNRRVLAPAERRRADALMRRITNAYKRPEIQAIDRQVADNSTRQFAVFQAFWGNGNADPTPNR